MESLFKFSLHRHAVQQQHEFPSIKLAQASTYQNALANALVSNDIRKAVKETSRQFVASNEFVGDPAQLPEHAMLTKLATELSLLEKKPNVQPNEVAKAISDNIGEPPGTFVKKKRYKDIVAMLKDTVLAIKHLPEEQHRSIEDISNLLRDLEVVQKSVDDASFPGSGASLRRYRRRPFLLPNKADMRSILDASGKAREEDEDVRKKELEKRKLISEKSALYQGLKRAINELLELDNQQLEESAQNAKGGFMPPNEIRPFTVLAASIIRKNSIGAIEVEGLRAGKLLKTSDGTEKTEGFSEKGDKGTGVRMLIAGTGGFQPALHTTTLFRLKVGADQQLSPDTRAILAARKFNLTTMALDHIVSSLRKEMEMLSDELDALTGNFVQHSFKRIGRSLVVIKTPTMSAWGKGGGSLSAPAPLPRPVDSRVPVTRGNISPAGVADLIIVKQHLKGYEARDVAHIENVLKGEAKIRDHRTLRQTIQTNFRETESTSTKEQELESTDRFEMRRESSQTIKEDASLKAGLTVSGSYGPSVQFSASVEGSLSRSKEEAVKTASSFSKEITQRSSEKITERILERYQMQITNEVEEKNNHTLNNVGGAGHISGVYQWVEKVYEAQMFNYGLRMMYDFMVPEPGAFLIASLQNSHSDALQIDKPAEFTIQPNHLNEVNYHYWIHQYGATGIQPPPQEFITKTLNYNTGGGDDKADYTHSGIIAIDEGYQAVQGSVGVVWNMWESTAAVDVVLGRRTTRFSDGDSWVWTANLNNETGSIPFALKTFRISDVSSAVEVKCRRTERAYKKWQLETHAKLMDAYQTKLSEYEATLAALEMRAGVAIQGKNPALNLTMMKDELKKHCITILTRQHFDLFDAIQNGTNGLPQLDLWENEAEGPYVRFFEQAFEWEQITWITYPYFWGRKSEWTERIAYEDSDPLFNDFLKAGYCRVMVPVRPGFEGAIDHFMTFGEVWNGGPLPAISSPLYLPIAVELAERLDRPGSEIPEGDPWEVRVPTTLVKLKADDALPQWQKDAQGNWLPA